MNIKTNLFLLLVLILVGCNSTSKMARTEKKIIQKIEKKISVDFETEKDYSFSDSRNFILVSGIKNQMKPAFVHLLVLNENIEMLFESKNEYRKAYWKGDVLLLEKIIGQIKTGDDINQKHIENKIIYQYNPQSKKLQRVESDL